MRTIIILVLLTISSVCSAQLEVSLSYGAAKQVNDKNRDILYGTTEWAYKSGVFEVGAHYSIISRLKVGVIYSKSQQYYKMDKYLASVKAYLLNGKNNKVDIGVSGGYVTFFNNKYPGYEKNCKGYAGRISAGYEHRIVKGLFAFANAGVEYISVTSGFVLNHDTKRVDNSIFGYGCAGIAYHVGR